MTLLRSMTTIPRIGRMPYIFFIPTARQLVPSPSLHRATHSIPTTIGKKEKKMSFDIEFWKDKTCNKCGEKGHPAYIHQAGSKPNKGKSGQGKSKKGKSSDDSSKSSKRSSRSSSSSKKSSSSKSKSKTGNTHISEAFITFGKELGKKLTKVDEGDESDITDSDDEEESHHSHFTCTVEQPTHQVYTTKASLTNTGLTFNNVNPITKDLT